jgi:hypothetical protein
MFPKMLVAERLVERKTTAAAMLIHNLNFSGEKKLVQSGQNISGFWMYNTALWQER